MSNRSGKAHSVMCQWFLYNRQRFQHANKELIPGHYEWELKANPSKSFLAKDVTILVDIFARPEGSFTDYIIAFSKQKPYRRPLFSVRARHIAVEEELFIFNCQGREYAVSHWPYQISAHFDRDVAPEWPELQDLFRNEAGYM